MFSKTIIIGNLGKDPETRKAGEHSVCSFSVAVKLSGKNAATEWYDVECWNKTADFVQEWFRKGSNIIVEGEMVTDSWEKDGERKYKTKLRAQNIKFGAKAAGSQDAGATIDKATAGTASDVSW